MGLGFALPAVIELIEMTAPNKIAIRCDATVTAEI